MTLAVSIQEFNRLSRKTEIAEILDFQKDGVSICISKHSDLGVSEILHYHDKPHLTLILQGGVLDKRKRDETSRISTEMMFFQSGEEHQTINKLLPTKYMSLTFDSDFFRQKSITEAKLDFLINHNINSKFTLLRIFKETLLDDDFSPSSIEMLLFNLTDVKRPVECSPPKWTKRVVELLNDNWNTQLSLNDLAEVADVHPNTISRCFPQYFACTVGEYRRKLKVEKSLALIKNSKLSLTEIANVCDFADQSHFIRNFKQITGFLPKQFRTI